MKLENIIPAALGIATGLLIFFAWTAILDNSLNDLDAQRGVTEAAYVLDK